MRRIPVIALNTFKENIRDKVLYNLLVFGLLLVGSSIVLGALTIGERARIIKDIGLAGINVFGVLIAIFVGIGLVSKEIEKRTIYTILAKPVARHEFLLGRFAGLVLTLFVNTAVMVGGFVAVLLLSGITPDLGLFQAISMIFMELIVLVALAVMFSTFTTPTLSAMFTLATYVIGHLAGDLRNLAEKLQDGLSRVLLDGLSYVLPNLAYFNIKGEVVHGVPITASYLLSALGYGLAYASFVIVLACMIFQRRDF